MLTGEFYKHHLLTELKILQFPFAGESHDLSLLTKVDIPKKKIYFLLIVCQEQLSLLALPDNKRIGSKTFKVSFHLFLDLLPQLSHIFFNKNIEGVPNGLFLLDQ